MLNASYEPLAVIPARRALSLLLRERVDPATDDKIALISPSVGVTIPSVLRLRRYVRVPRRGVRWSRAGVLRRDAYTCIYCGAQAGVLRGNQVLTKAEFTIDHLIPRSRAGRNTWVNTACACKGCNQRKGDRMPHEAGMPLRWEPKTPRVDYLVASGTVPMAWKVYLEV